MMDQTRARNLWIRPLGRLPDWLLPLRWRTTSTATPVDLLHPGGRWCCRVRDRQAQALGAIGLDLRGFGHIADRNY